MKITVIVTVYNNSRHLAETLDSLCSQTSEDFDVLIVDDGSTDDSPTIIDKYCREYVGFTSLRTEHRGSFNARNEGMKTAGGDYFIFMDGNSFLSEESIEALSKTAEETKADIVTMRYYTDGDVEGSYDVFADMIAVSQDIDKFDKALLNTMQYNNKMFRKKIPELYDIRFEDRYAFSFALFCMKAAFAGAKIVGCTDAAMAQSLFFIRDGYSAEERPGSASLRAYLDVMSELAAMAKSILIETTGGFDGDEYYAQEFNYHRFELLTKLFYRNFWFMTDDDLDLIRENFERLSGVLSKARKDKINKNNADIRFPAMFISHKDAAAMPRFSFILDCRGSGSMKELVNSFYCQTFPFFELFVMQSDMDAGRVPAVWKGSENLTVLPDEGFFDAARARAGAKAVIVVRSTEPVDVNILSQLAVVHVPAGMIPYEFTRRRKTAQAKTALKRKGLSME